MKHEIPAEPISKIMAECYSNDFAGVHYAAEIFPMPTADEFAALCQSIEEYGLEEPLLRDKETRLLVDGRSRLLACFVVSQELRIVDTDAADLVTVSLVRNLHRRQLSFDQKAMVGGEAKAAFARQAKERQGARTDINIQARAPECLGQARDQAGKAAGVGGKSVDKAADLIAYAPKEAEQVKAGKKTLAQAARDAAPVVKQAKAEKKAKQQATKPRPKQVVSVITTDGKSAEIKKPDRVVFNPTNENVDWAAYTWNPVTGCNHGCKFCYAREIASEMHRRGVGGYNFNFEPALHEYRLTAPTNTKPGDGRDGRVFVCSMADLFGKWVPDEWIEKVFSACMASPEWEYMFLTKWPKRYAMLADLPRAWFGASIIQQVDVARVERDMLAFHTSGIKWISLEPMLEPITFSDLSWCDMVVIGAQTETNQPDGRVPDYAPAFDWVVDVVNQCREWQVPYYLKPNLGVLNKNKNLAGMDLPRPEITLQ
jgi:protein gp37/ParB-like chromosome segregation protein Spo0J